MIANVNKPTLILSHNKTLAGQLYGEMKKFVTSLIMRLNILFPTMTTYQPGSIWVPSSDTYIMKKMRPINDEIDKLRHSATTSLLERNDVIVVAPLFLVVLD